MSATKCFFSAENNNDQESKLFVWKYCFGPSFGQKALAGSHLDPQQKPEREERNPPLNSPPGCSGSSPFPRTWVMYSLLQVRLQMLSDVEQKPPNSRRLRYFEMPNYCFPASARPQTTGSAFTVLSPHPDLKLFPRHLSKASHYKDALWNNCLSLYRQHQHLQLSSRPLVQTMQVKEKSYFPSLAQTTILC